MIQPHKYLDLNTSILSLGGLILNILKEHNSIKYDELLNKVVISKGIDSERVFIPTLSFLYLLGKLEYRRDLDTIELTR